MELLKKRPIAILIMLGAMVLSVFIGGRRSLQAAREEIMEYFYTGSDGSSYSIQDDLEYISATAGNLKTVALRYMDGSDPYIVQLNDSRATLDDAQTPEEKADAANQLFGVVSALYAHLDPAEYRMNSTDKSFRSSLYEDISSAMQRIAENEYNTLAEEFNDMLETKLTGTIAKFTGIGKVPIYE